MVGVNDEKEPSICKTLIYMFNHSKKKVQFREKRKFIHLRETDDFASDVASVPRDGYLPHDVRQDANDADTQV